MRKDLPKNIRLRILLCAVTAVLTLICMIAVVSAEEGDALPPEAAPVSETETVQYTAVVVDGTTGAPVPEAQVSVPNSADEGQVYGNESYFTVPEGGEVQATVSAEGYATATGQN